MAQRERTTYNFTRSAVVTHTCIHTYIHTYIHTCIHTSMATERADCIQFYSICSGLQFNFDMAYAGRAHMEGDGMRLSLFKISAVNGNK
jgi:hypothetical protein